MDNNKKDNKNLLITFFLVVSIILNFYTITKMNMIREELSHEFNKIGTSLKKELDEMNYNLIELEKASSWVSDITVKSYQKSDGILNVKFALQIKDYTDGSEVKFFSRKVGDDNYQQYPVIQENDGNFSVLMVSNIVDIPEWHINYYLRDNYESEGQNDEVSYRYEYYVSLNDGNRTITSDVDRVNMRKELLIYSTIDVDIEQRKNKFIVGMSFLDEKIIPSKAVLEIYNGEDKKEELVEIDREKRYAIWETSETMFDKIVARVEYSDGNTYIKEIWDKDKTLPWHQFRN